MKRFLFLGLILTVLQNSVFPQCGTTNLALNKQTTVSSTNPNGGGPDHQGPQAVDGSLSTSWWSADNTANNNNTTDFVQWLYVDLTQAYNICQVVVKWDNDYRALNFKVQVSSDASNWIDLATKTDNTSAINTFDVSGSGRYVRIHATRLAVFWANNYSLAELEVYNSVNNNPPTVSITDPANNGNFTSGSNININATAADSDGSITKVEFYQGATKLGEDLTSPYSYTWTSVASGSYSLTAKATDNLGAVTTSSAINITVSSNLAPTVSITSPSNNSHYTSGGNITIDANASDPDGSITKVEFYLDYTLLGTDLTAPYSYTLNNVTAGALSFTAKAFDNNNATTTSSAVIVNASSVWSLTGVTGTTVGNNFLGTTDNKDLVVKTYNQERMRVGSGGNVGIGTTNITDAGYKLFVETGIRTRKIKVDQTAWPDYVFDKKYQLPTLQYVEQYIRRHKHLPDVPSANEIETQGLNLGDNQAVLLRKIEELTLYILELNKKVEDQNKKMKEQDARIEKQALQLRKIASKKTNKQ